MAEIDVSDRRGLVSDDENFAETFSTEEGDGEGGGGGDFVGRRSILTTHCHYWDENDDDMVARVERGGSTDSASSREDTIHPIKTDSWPFSVQTFQSLKGKNSDDVIEPSEQKLLASVD